MAVNVTFQGIFHEKKELLSISHLLFVLLLCLCQTVNIVGKCASIRYISKNMPKGRPINSMMKKDQVVQLVAFGSVNLLFLSSIGLHQSIEELFGFESCIFIMGSAAVGQWSLLLGGCFQAIFRLIYTEAPHLMTDKRNANMYGETNSGISEKHFHNKL